MYVYPPVMLIMQQMLYSIFEISTSMQRIYSSVYNSLKNKINYIYTKTMREAAPKPIIKHQQRHLLQRN